MADWRKIPEGGSVFALRLIILIARICGRRVAGGVLYVVAFYFAAMRKDARSASRDYLRRIGEPATFRNVVRHMHTFARVTLDRLFFLTGRLEQFEFEHTNHDLLVDIAKSGRGVLLLGAHLGSFECMRARANKYSLPLNVLADYSNAARVNGVLRSLAPNFDVRLIPLGEDPLPAMLEIKAAIERGELVAMLADRRPPSGRVVKTPFLGGEASFPAGPWVIAHTLRCPVYFVAGVFTKPNRYSLHFELVADEVRLERRERDAALAHYAAIYAKLLEAHTRKAPLNWFNFYDFWSKA